jgi:hypothetical protein
MGVRTMAFWRLVKHSGRAATAAQNAGSGDMMQLNDKLTDRCYYQPRFTI